MTAAQRPNPLDRLLFTADDARARCGLSGADIHGVCECRGRLDVEGLLRAIACLHRRYPLTCARLTRGALTGNPRWSLHPPPRERAAYFTVHGARQDDARAAQAQLLEQALQQRLPWHALLPMQFHLLRGAHPGDVLLVRLPHALMDARAVIYLLEELAAFYRAGEDPASLPSAGDEHRDDWGVLGPPLSRRGALWAVAAARGVQPPALAEALRLCPPVYGRGPQRLAHRVLRLSPEQTSQVRDAALRTSGFARAGEFLRAAGIVALCETARALGRAGALLTTLHLIELRRARETSARLRNLFVAAPIAVPVAQATDCRAAADCIHTQLSEFIRRDGRLRQMALLRLLAVVPAALSARITEPARARGARGWRLGLENPPSLPMGLLSPPGRPLRDFCGAEMINFYGAQPPAPSGFVVNVNATEDRMNVSIVFDADRLAPQVIEAFGGALVARLTRTPGAAPS